MASEHELSARVESFDSFWQAPEDVEEGYDSFRKYYRHNFLEYLPTKKDSHVLVVSCGPGYFVSLLEDEGYCNVLGIDSDPEKVKYAEERALSCEVAEAFSFLEGKTNEYDLIICEQELNHLTKKEMIEFLTLCRMALQPNGRLIVYGINGANPITGAEALTQNFDHFNAFTEYSLKQVLEICGFGQIYVFPLNLYVFYKNPLNYIGIAVTSLLRFLFRLLFIVYGKDNKIFTKKIAAVCSKLS